MMQYLEELKDIHDQLRLKIAYDDDLHGQDRAIVQLLMDLLTAMIQAEEKKLTQQHKGLDKPNALGIE